MRKDEREKGKWSVRREEEEKVKEKEEEQVGTKLLE